jgi:imidazolonepropionase-like amidohydrolase
MMARLHWNLTLAIAAFLSATAFGEVIAVTGGTVHTMGERGTLQGATVLIRDGRIAAVGTDVAVPAEARRIDARGKVVTPGIIDAHGQIGIEEIPGVEQTVDAASSERRFTASFDVVDAINPRSVVIPVNRIEGITRAVVAPTHTSGGSLIAGRGAIIALVHPTDYVTRSPAAMYATFGEWGARLSGGSRGVAMLHLREAFEDARDFAANRAAFEQRGRRDYALSRLDLEALQPVVAGELPFVLGVNRASDIRAALRLAGDYGLRLVILGGAEAWMVADEIAAAGVPVLINPLQNLPDSFEILGATLENAARLHAAGVTIAFASGQTHNARNVTQHAGNAVAHGLPWDAAMAALTVAPARIWDIGDRVGRLEPGLDADVVVWDGDPLEVTTYADHVLIRGIEVPMHSRHTRLRDRYLNLEDQTVPRAYRRE